MGNTLGNTEQMRGECLECLGNTVYILNSTILGHHEFKQTILSKSQRIKDLKQMEVALKETAKLNTEKLRKKMIQDGVKNLEKRRAEIETYKLKVVELKLWKRKWQTRQRSLQLKKRKRKEKIVQRREWINEQISKGYMHKSCKVLVHTRAKFPFEPGFDMESSRKRMKKSISDDNLACLIRGVHIDKNGLVYPCKKRTDIEPKNNKKVISSPQISLRSNSVIEASSIIAESQPQIITEEPIFTITEDGTLLQVGWINLCSFHIKILFSLEMTQSFTDDKKVLW